MNSICLGLFGRCGMFDPDRVPALVKRYTLAQLREALAHEEGCRYPCNAGDLPRGQHKSQQVVKTLKRAIAVAS